MSVTIALWTAVNFGAFDAALLFAVIFAVGGGFAAWIPIMLRLRTSDALLRFCLGLLGGVTVTLVFGLLLFSLTSKWITGYIIGEDDFYVLLIASPITVLFSVAIGNAWACD